MTDLLFVNLPAYLSQDERQGVESTLESLDIDLYLVVYLGGDIRSRVNAPEMFASVQSSTMAARF